MRLPPFPSLVWIVILGTFMVRTSFFMVWPFLSILLYREYGLSASGIGMLLGGAAVLSCLIGFYVGWLSDRLGRRTILLLGCALSCGTYLLLGFGHSLWLIALGVFGSGLSYAFIDTPGKALMGDLLPEKAQRELALHLRYFLLNVGAGVGPLIGVMVGLGARQETFVVTAASYGLLGIAFLLGFRRDCASRPDTGLSLGAMLRVVGRDRAFMLFILANLLMNLVYAQVESPLIQYLTRAGAPEVETLVALLVATNALTIITLQFPLLHLTRRWRVSLRLQFSILLMASAQVMFALSSPALLWPWLVAMFLLSVGEAVLFPLFNVLIDQMAPAHLKGSYFGASALAGLGWAFSPMVGGWFLQVWGGPALFAVMTAICMLVFALYGMGRREARPSASPAGCED
ncbi:MDR family MFS transporter [Aeromonas sp. s5]|uniref:MDR family MFS transporter n=1 Tax=Aeromonas sp. s5 TaxID=3138487 RepID=UPI0034A0FB30